MTDLRRIRASRDPRAVLPVQAIARDGVITRTDNAVVRVLELTPRAATTAVGPDLSSLASGLTAVIGQLAPGEGLQWYVEARPVTPDALLAERHADADELVRADADFVAGQLPTPAAVERGTYLVVSTTGARRRLGIRGDHERLLEQSLMRVDRLRQTLAEQGLAPRLLDGPDVSRLLLRRLFGSAGTAQERRVEIVGSLDPAQDAEQADALVERMLAPFETHPVEFSDARIVRIASDLEQTIHLSAAPTSGLLSWLRTLFGIKLPFVLSIHVCAREGGTFELTLGQTVRAPGPDPRAAQLAAPIDQLVRDSFDGAGIRLDRGEFVQEQLWAASLPLGLRQPRLAHVVDAAIAAEAAPVLGEECGSPGGVPLARSPRGMIERIDPWDAAHRTPSMAVAAGDGVHADTLLTIVTRLSWAVPVVVADLDGRASARWRELGLPGPYAVQAPADVLDATGDSRITLLDASAAGDPVAVVGAARALLDGRTASAPRDDDARPARGALVVAGASRMLARPGGTACLRDAVTQSGASGCCVVLGVASLLELDAADLLALISIRLVLRHRDEEADELARTLGLTRIEASVLRRLDGTGAAPTALLYNGRRGRGAVRLIPLGQPVSTS